MKKVIKKIFLFLLPAFAGFAVFCEPPHKVASVQSEVASFAELDQKIRQMSPEALKHTLLVMDDDDTLTMMSCPDQGAVAKCQYLGGPAWFSWQDDLKAGSPYAVARDFDGLLEISTLLFAINDMPYTEADLPGVLVGLSDSGVRLLVLTARGLETFSATAAQFKTLSVDSSTSFLNLISANGLLGKKSNISSVAGPFYPCNETTNKPVVYQQGAMFVAGQNKGEMLECLLGITDSSSISNIIFIDDTLQNVKDVYAAFENSTRYSVQAFHYTALQKHKAALTKDKKYQNKARARWNAIHKALKKELLKPALP